MNHRHPQSRHTPHGGSEKKPPEESSFPPPSCVCCVCPLRARALFWLSIRAHRALCRVHGVALAASLPVICGDSPVSRASPPSSFSPQAGAPLSLIQSLSGTHSITVKLRPPRFHLVDARPGVGGLSLSLSLSHSLPNVYASFSSRRHSGFRPNPALCHTTARHLALGESPNVGQNRTARQHPGMNGCFGCSDSPPPHCLCQSSARTQGGC